LRESYSKFSLRARPTVMEDDRATPIPSIVTEWLRQRLREVKSSA